MITTNTENDFNNNNKQFLTIMKIRGTLLIATIVGAFILSLSWPVYGQNSMESGIILPSFPYATPLDSVVLFGFDDRAFPYKSGAQIHLKQGESPRVVLEPGPPGSHDEFIRYYGTVLRIDDTFHMWYYGNYGDDPGNIGYGHGAHPGDVLCYATSKDGINWTKPNLGLVEYNGSKNNNIVDFPEPNPRPSAAILYEPEDPDPNRRFKLAYEADRGGGAKFLVAFSPDGLHWTLSEKNPVGPFFEMQGITKFRDNYYVNGQVGLTTYKPFRTRQLATFASKDFEHWSPVAALGLDRSTDLSGPSTENEWNTYEEIHLGAGLWNRGNVLVGIYGQWHGHPTGDRRLVSMDLGLALSHDALHFQEPIPGYKFIPAREQPESPGIGYPALMQGQGMMNVGDETYYWYSTWKGIEGTGVRLVSWDRDRLGMLKPFKRDAQTVSAPIEVSGNAGARVFVNASGLGEHTELRINVLDEAFKPVSGYSGDEAAVIENDNLRLPVRWGDGDVLPSDEVYHIQVIFDGVRPEDANLHAIYIETLK